MIATLCTLNGVRSMCSTALKQPWRKAHVAAKWMKHGAQSLHGSVVRCDDESKIEELDAVKSSSIQVDSTRIKKKTTQFLEPVEAPFPEGFTEDMKQRVRMIVAMDDLVYSWDDSWKKDVHPLVDGEQISMHMMYEQSIRGDNEIYIENNVPTESRVKLTFGPKALKLDTRGHAIFAELMGPRYDPKRDRYKITCDLYPSRKHNLKRCVDILHDLVENSHRISQEEQVEAIPSAEAK